MKEKKETNQKKTMVDQFEKTFLGKYLLVIAVLALVTQTITQR